MTKEEIYENNRLIALFLGCVVDYNVVDWSEYNNKSITERWNNNKGTFVHTPKGVGLPWYKVKHRNNFYQLFTDYTFQKLKEEDLELGCTYNNKYYLIKDLKFHSSYDWLMLCFEKLRYLQCTFEISVNKCTIKNWLGFFNTSCIHKNTLGAAYECLIEYIKWYNDNNKK